MRYIILILALVLVSVTSCNTVEETEEIFEQVEHVKSEQACTTEDQEDPTEEN